MNFSGEREGRRWPVAAAAMRPGPPNTSRRRPPRRQQLPHRLHRSQSQVQQIKRPISNSQAFFLLFLLASNPILALADPPPATALPGLVSNDQLNRKCPSPKEGQRQNLPVSEKAPRKPHNLTIGYLTAIKGVMKDRQGLAISGALSMALDEVFLLFFN